ncbi:response regulator [Alkalihalobacillus pseudalcaliphilus]|uniref:response regulator n=1 Tax=Alkalihalobacillus pseudalcaliphilus TaxID=79884 RepID=UPI00064DBCF6|nr:response regulator [Alkalihalobacillus pseudalcaliphilus]KMK78001.1 hypothetical protein AB990_00675 [Alkalihalobacillus pseudalcaliphilus]
MNIVLFDDEPLALDYLEHQLKMIQDVHIVGKYTTFESDNLYSQIAEADVIFSDIEMVHVNGFDIAKALAKQTRHIPIVFVTGYEKYAVKAFDIDALDYLLKPVTLKRLTKTIDKIESYYAARQHVQMPHESLTIHVLGEFSFQLGSQAPEVINWRTNSACQLFLYLLQQHNEVVSKDYLLELLFPHLDLNKAKSQLYATIYQVRQAISPYKAFLHIRNIQNGYILQIKHTIIDKISWQLELENAPLISFDTIKKHEEIAAKYKGSYLNQMDYLWADQERLHLENKWLDHCSIIATFYKEHQHERAEYWFSKILKSNPEHEEAHFALMKWYAYHKKTKLLEKQFQEYTHTLEDLGLPINSNIAQWYTNYQNTTRTHS